MEGDAIPARCRHARYLPGFCLHAHTRRVEHGRRTGRVNTGKQRRRSALVKSRPTHSLRSSRQPVRFFICVPTDTVECDCTERAGPAQTELSFGLFHSPRCSPTANTPPCCPNRHSCVRADRHGGREGRDVLRSADRAIFTTPPGLLSLAHGQQLELWFERLIWGAHMQPLRSLDGRSLLILPTNLAEITNKNGGCG